MISVLHVVPDLGSGGLEQLLKQWYPLAKENEIRFVFSVQSEGGVTYNFFQNEGCKIIRTERIVRIGFWKFVKQYKEIIRNNNIDIVHVPASPSSWLVLLAAKLSGCKCRIIHAHTNLYVRSSGNELPFAIRKCIMILNNKLSTIRLTGSSSAGKYCFGENDFELIRNGIDLEKFSFDKEARAIKRKELGVDSELLIGSVGRLVDQKNQQFLLRIANEIINNKGTKCKIIFLGEGENKKVLEQIIKEYSLDSNVMFLGTTSNLAPFYFAMDAFVFPSKYEGLGIAAVEAQACGTQTFLSEFVPNDAIISSNTIVLSLDDSPEKWADIIICHHERNTHGVRDAQKCGYDVNETSKRVINIYKTSVDKHDY